MKKTLLFITLLVTAFGYSQTYNNSAGYYINTMIASISGTDEPNEFIEFRGPAGTSFPAGTYLITIEGDGDDTGDVGEVEEVLDLSGLTFGANGYLTLTYTGNSYTTVLAASNSNDYTEADVDGYDGNLADYSASYLLISASSKPSKDLKVDVSPLDGEFDATGDHTSWNIYDSVSSLDDKNSPEYGYGQIIVATNYTTKPADFKFPSTSTVISIDDDNGSTSNVYYIGRQGESTGYSAVSDWMAGQTNSVSGGSTILPNWSFTTRLPKVSPNSLAGTTLTNGSFGGINLDPVDDATASVNELFSSKISIYPNPANEFIEISTTEQITGLEVYSLIGKKVISVTNSTNKKINISSLAKGVYILKVLSNDLVGSRKIIIE